MRNHGQLILNYDADNCYPQRILSYIEKSGVASGCINLHQNFIEGEGFTDNKFHKQIINRKRQRVDQLLRLCAKDYARFGGFALHINYNSLYEISSVNHIKFEYARWGLPDDYEYIPFVALYNDWDKKNYSKDKSYQIIDYIDVYNPDPATIQAQVDRDGGFMNYRGQVLYYTGDSQSYPQAPFHSIIEDIQSDAEIKMFKLRNLQNGFMGNYLLRYPGTFADDEERQDFMASVRQHQGANRAGKILLIEEEGGDSSSPKTTLEAMELQNVDKLFEHTERSVTNNIIGAFNQPLALHPIQTPGALGRTEEIKNSFMFYNEFTKKDRRIFQEIFEDVFSKFAREINTTGDYSITPLEWAGTEKEGNNGISTDSEG